MRMLIRNKQPIIVRNLVSKTEIIDEYGNATGQFQLNFSEPQEIKGNVSSAVGAAEARIFGIVDGYDKVIVLEDLGQISETSEIWQEGYKHIVVRIAKSLNNVSLAVRKVLS